MKRTGRILINTGDGKGKTTAALGTALRAAGNGQQVAIVQFLKGSWSYGELTALERFPNIFLARVGGGFTWEQDPDEARQLARRGWEMCKKLVASDEYDLLVLDELNVALSYSFLDLQDVLDLLEHLPDRLSVIITGRDAPPALIEAADTVTEMKLVKHGYEDGAPAKKGIEY